MRRILSIDIDGSRLVGTCHEPAGNGTGSAARDRVAVLILNFAQLPRAGLGDMPVLIADQLAADGYPAFRFDLPGFGDSPGNLPEYVETHWDFIERGGFAPWTTALIAELIRKFELRGIVLGGLCGGAYTSIFAVDRCRTGVLGLVLLEPSFYLIATSMGLVKPQAGSWQPRRWFADLRKSMRTKKWLTPLRWLYGLLKRIRVLLLGPILSDDVNVPMVMAARRLAAAAMPMLVVSAGKRQRWFVRDVVFGSIRRHRLTFIEVEGTNHMLVPGGGKVTVVGHVRDWFAATFPHSLHKGISGGPDAQESESSRPKDPRSTAAAG